MLPCEVSESDYYLHNAESITLEELFKAEICVVIFRRERHFLWETVEGAGGHLYLHSACWSCTARCVRDECVGQPGSCYLCQPVAGLFVSRGGEIDRARDRLVLERDISSENAMTFYRPYLFIAVDGNGLSLLMYGALSPCHTVSVGSTVM